MAFRYINPGYVSLLDSDCVAVEVAGTSYSKTGVGFSQTNSTAGITTLQFTNGDDFWAKFDAYIPSESASNIYFFMPNSYSNGIEINLASKATSASYLYLQYGTSGRKQITNGVALNLGISQGKINTFLIHIKQGTSSTAQVNFWINGKEFSQSGYAMTYRDARPKIAILYSTNPNVIFSNIIFASEEISIKERAIALPINQTVTNMTAGASGLFIADAANQTLLQSVDVSTLIENFGASSAVTGIALVGNPAYATGTGITSLIGLSQSAGVSAVEHGTCALSEDTDAIILDGWSFENMTIAGLSAMQFGWKAGE